MQLGTMGAQCRLSKYCLGTQIQPHTCDNGLGLNLKPALLNQQNAL